MFTNIWINLDHFDISTVTTVGYEGRQTAIKDIPKVRESKHKYFSIKNTYLKYHMQNHRLDWYQAMLIWTNADLLWIELTGTNVDEIWT